MELYLEGTLPAIQEADTDNPSAVEAAATRVLSNSDITFPHHNQVQQVINESLSVSDDEDDSYFDNNDSICDVIIGEAKNTETQIDAERAVEEEEVNNNNDFWKAVTRAMIIKTTHHMYYVIQ